MNPFSRSDWKKWAWKQTYPNYHKNKKHLDEEIDYDLYQGVIVLIVFGLIFLLVSR